MNIYNDIMETLEKNVNGKLQWTEFLTAFSNKEEILNEQNFKIAFNTFDIDRNGSISRQELKEIFECGEKKDEEMWNQIFMEVDLDKDNNISYDEFR